MVSDLVLLVLVESLSIVKEADGDEVLLYGSPSASRAVGQRRRWLVTMSEVMTMALPL